MPLPHLVTSRRTLVLAGMAATLVRPALAWTPSAPVRVLIGFPPGGAVDILVRILAEGVRTTAGVTLVPEVRSGAYGFLALQAAVQARPDGLTLASAVMGMLCVLPEVPGVPVPVDLEREIAPVCALAGTPMALVARPDAPFTDLDGMIAYVRGANGRASYASSGNGSINHLGGAALAQALGVEMTHVAYRGGAPAGLDVAAGRVDLMVANVAEVAPMIRAGQLRGIAVTAAVPSFLMPELPPLAARFPALEINNWFGVAGPAGLPAEIKDGLAALFATALRDPQTVRTLRERGLDPIGEPPEAFTARIRRDRARWRGVIQAGNIRGD